MTIYSPSFNPCMKSTINKLERIFSEICSESYHAEWDGNLFSFLLTKKLRELFGNRRIYFNNWSKIVDWKSYKNRRKQKKSSRQELQLKFPDEKTWLSHLWVSPLNTTVVKLEQLNPNANKSVLRTAFPFAMFLSASFFGA